MRATVMMAAAPGLGGLYGMVLGRRLGSGRAVPCRAARSFSAGNGGIGSLLGWLEGTGPGMRTIVWVENF